jgi:hypothetical protein
MRRVREVGGGGGDVVSLPFVVEAPEEGVECGLTVARVVGHGETIARGLALHI